MINFIIIIIIANGGVYAFGDNTYGELGIEGVLSLEKPTKVTFFDSIKEKVKKICVGARHSLVLLENGVVYAFGDNSESQCTGSSTRYPKPVKINWESKELIVDIFSNYNHCVFVTSN